MKSLLTACTIMNITTWKKTYKKTNHIWLYGKFFMYLLILYYYFCWNYRVEYWRTLDISDRGGESSTLQIELIEYIRIYLPRLVTLLGVRFEICKSETKRLLSRSPPSQWIFFLVEWELVWHSLGFSWTSTWSLYYFSTKRYTNKLMSNMMSVI